MDSTLTKHCNIWTKNLTNLPRFSVVTITDSIIIRNMKFMCKMLLHNLMA